MSKKQESRGLRYSIFQLTKDLALFTSAILCLSLSADALSASPPQISSLKAASVKSAPLKVVTKHKFGLEWFAVDFSGTSRPGLATSFTSKINYSIGLEGKYRFSRFESVEDETSIADFAFEHYEGYLVYQPYQLKNYGNPYVKLGAFYNATKDVVLDTGQVINRSGQVGAAYALGLELHPLPELSAYAEYSTFVDHDLLGSTSFLSIGVRYKLSDVIVVSRPIKIKKVKRQEAASRAGGSSGASTKKKSPPATIYKQVNPLSLYRYKSNLYGANPNLQSIPSFNIEQLGTVNKVPGFQKKSGEYQLPAFKTPNIAEEQLNPAVVETETIIDEDGTEEEQVEALEKEPAEQQTEEEPVQKKSAAPFFVKTNPKAPNCTFGYYLQIMAFRESEHKEVAKIEAYLGSIYVPYDIYAFRDGVGVIYRLVAGDLKSAESMQLLKELLVRENVGNNDAFNYCVVNADKKPLTQQQIQALQ